MLIRDDKFLKNKVKEYIDLLGESGYISSKSMLFILKNRLLNMQLNPVTNMPAEFMINKNGLNICYENWTKKVEKYGNIFTDEALFHEFSHIINDFHQSINGNRRFDFLTYISEGKNPCSITESPLAENDFISNQDPREGILLLDEFIAQRMSQDLVKIKAEKLSLDRLKLYDKCHELDGYSIRNYITHITEPPTEIPTSFVTYQEFDICAKAFIVKYGFQNVQEFIELSLSRNGLKKMIAQNKNCIDEMLVDLCYLAIIRNRVYYLSGLKSLDDNNDQARDPAKVGMVLKRIIP